MNCDICNYSTDDRSNFRRHLNSKAHKKQCNKVDDVKVPEISIATLTQICNDGVVPEQLKPHIEKYIQFCMSKCREVNIDLDRYFELGHYRLDKPSLLLDILSIILDREYLRADTNKEIQW
jgi:hypothetical protein